MVLAGKHTVVTTLPTLGLNRHSVSLVGIYQRNGRFCAVQFWQQQECLLYRIVLNLFYIFPKVYLTVLMCHIVRCNPSSFPYWLWIDPLLVRQNTNSKSNKIKEPKAHSRALLLDFTCKSPQQEDITLFSKQRCFIQFSLEVIQLFSSITLASLVLSFDNSAGLMFANLQNL